jgi:hypothetical protein
MVMSLWLPWSRIDRATFQYHVFTVLPFSFMALAYFMAELWHGPSPRTWQLAKASAGLAIIGAPLLWLFREPLCGLANTEQVNKGSEVCGAVSRDFTLTGFQLIGIVLAIVGLVAAGLLVVYQRQRREGIGGRPISPLWLPISLALSLLGAVLVVIGTALPGNAVFQSNLGADVASFVMLLILSPLAYFALQGRDPKRYVVGFVAAATVWFVFFYPNFGSLPVPTAISQMHLVMLPTWNWAFQFGVNLDAANRDPINWMSVAILTIAVAGLVAAAIYAVYNRRELRRQPAIATGADASLPADGAASPPA